MKFKPLFEIDSHFQCLRYTLGELTYGLNLEHLEVQHSASPLTEPLYDLKIEDNLYNVTLKLEDEISVLCEYLNIDYIISKEVKNNIKKQIKSYARF